MAAVVAVVVAAAEAAPHLPRVRWKAHLPQVLVAAVATAVAAVVDGGAVAVIAAVVAEAVAVKAAESIVPHLPRIR